MSFKNIDWKKAIGFGVALWVLMFVIVSAFIGFKVYTLPGMNVVSAVISAVIAYIFAGMVKPKDYATAFVYALSWIIVAWILDLVITRQFNPNIGMQWSIWLGDLLVILAVLFRVKKA